MFSFILFLWYQTLGITGGDSGDLVAAAALFGVPHPPGYPLYTALAGLLIRIPGMTASWKSAFMSSVPSALTIGCLFILSYQLTKRYIPGIFAALILAGNYVFFLYSISPEVFALLNFFLVLTTGFFLLWLQTGRKRYLYWLAFSLGLGMTHHHLLLFILPAMVVVGWRIRERREVVLHNLPKLICFGVIGFLPYLYVLFAGNSSAIVNWDRPITVNNVIRLISRSDYGTFQSGAFYLGQMGQRILQVKMYAQLVLLDIRFIGVLSALVGWWWLRRRDKRIWMFVTIAIISLGPWFFFYAGFPLLNRFTLGTYERFLLPSYVFLSWLIGIGMWQIAVWISTRIGTVVRLPKPWLTALTMLALAIYPVTMVSTTLWRFNGMKTDFTADRLGMDILQTVSQNGIVLLGRDTPLFIAQYVRYATNYRSDVILLHGTLFESDYYPAVIRHAYPQLRIPETTPSQFTKEFIAQNRAQHEIYSNIKLSVDPDSVWVPHGLLYRLELLAELPSLDELIAENDRVWKTYGNPRAGILSRYNHLMLSDVLDVYGASRNEFGNVLLKAQKYEKAKEYSQAGIDLAGDSQLPQAYVNLGLAEMGLKNCQAAFAAFDTAEQFHLAPHVELKVYRAITYRDCVGDAVKAQEYFSQYDAARKETQTKLQPQ